MIIDIILITLLLIILMKNIKNTYKEHFGNYSSSCKDLPKFVTTVLDKRQMKYNNNDYDTYIPCTYNSCEKDILEFQNKKNKKIFIIDGCDLLASKLDLWDLLRYEYKDNAGEYMPTTHLLENKTDMYNFPRHFMKNKNKNPNQLYVLKNYEQRQEGIKLTRNLNEIMEGINKGWYLVQDYIYNPYLIDGHKINMRYYLLIVCRNNQIESYIHNNGFMYYTPKKYDPEDPDFNKHITTGYIDRKIYDINPLTHFDFRKYLENKKTGSSQLWDKNAKELFSKVMKAINRKICKNDKLSNHVRFQLFGCDLAPDENLNGKLIEINKGPDMGAKDLRDKKVKDTVMEDIFKIVDPLHKEDKNTGFIKI
jgi:hypothetical protein